MSLEGANAYDLWTDEDDIGIDVDDPSPTVKDALAVADTIVDTYDVQSILLYGSVHTGDSHFDSDLDLYVIFDDLGDYSVRQKWAEVVQETASTRSHAPVDLVIRDVPEWAAYASLKSTFEHQVQTRHRELYARSPLNADYDKYAFPRTDIDLAYRMLRLCIEDIAHMTTMLRHTDSTPLSKYQEICRTSENIVVNAILAIGCAKELPYPPKSKTLAALMDYVSGGDTDLCSKLQQGLKPAVPEYVSYFAPLSETRPEEARPLPIMVQHAAGDMSGAALNLLHTSTCILREVSDGRLTPDQFRDRIEEFVENASENGLRWVVDISKFD